MGVVASKGCSRGLAVLTAALLTAASAIGLSPSPALAAARHGDLGWPTFRTVGEAPVLPPGDILTGRLPAGALVHAAVVLQPRRAAALSEYADAVATPHGPLYHHYLSVASFRAHFAPPAATLALVRTELRHLGLVVGPTAADGLLVPIESRSSVAAAAFRTGFRSVRLANGKSGFMTTSAPRLPAAIAPDVSAILGLDETLTPQRLGTSGPTRATARTRATRTSAPGAATLGSVHRAPTACPAAKAAAATFNSYSDDQIAHAYGFDGLYSRGVLGAGQTVALFELDTFSMSDLAAFDRCYFGTSHTDQVSEINVDGGEAGGPGGGEAALDVEDVSAYAPDAHIDVYDAPSTLVGWIDEMAAIVAADKASVVSISYGLCEAQMSEASPGLVPTENILFEEGALQGQSLLAASGDSGSETCSRNDPTDESLSVSDPAAQPFVTSVGGTSLKSVAEPPAETVWNDGGDSAAGGGFGDGSGGGGISDVWPMPAWQSASAVPGVENGYSTGTPCNAAVGTDCREVPDVSASADQDHGDTIVYGGFWQTIGGTSAASPKWAAALAETNSLCASEHLGSIGFVNPLLYEIAANPVTYAEAFSDVTKGNNDVLGIHHGAYPAAVGYDLASGLGSPRVTGPAGSTGLASLLCSDAAPASGTPTITSISPDFGSSLGGTTVVLHGANLSGVTEIQFGPAAEPVSAGDVSGGGSRLTITTPPSPVQAFGSHVPVGGVLVEVAGRSGASDPNASVQFHYVAGSDASPVPSVFYVRPSTAPAGAPITIYGSGFEEGVPTVAIGGVTATNVTVVSDTELTATVPAEGSGTDCVTAAAGVPPSGLCQTDVTVTNSNGTSAEATILPPPTGTIAYLGLLPNPGSENVPAVTEFDYQSVPVLSSVMPTVIGANVFAAYGDPVTPQILTIGGTGFNYFSLDSVEATVPGHPSLVQGLFVGVITFSSLEVASPSYSGLIPSAIDINAVSDGTATNSVSVSVAPDDLTAAGISVGSGTDIGGTSVTVTGTDLSSIAEVLYLGAGGSVGSSTTDIVQASNDSVTFITPAAPPSRGTFLVCNASECVGSARTTPFAYFDPAVPVVTKVTPARGSSGGGEDVLVHGSGLGSVVGVRFGSTLAPARNESSFSGQATDVVVATVPPGRIGRSVRLTVVTLAGTSEPSAGRFTYVRGAPGPATAVSGLVRPGALLVHWGQPVSDGGSPITGYVVRAYPRHRRGHVGCHSQVAKGYVPTAHFGPAARSALLPTPTGQPFAICVTSYSALGQQRSYFAHLLTVRVGGDDGYLVAAADGYARGYGAFGGLPVAPGGTRTANSVIAAALDPNERGYWELTADGIVHAVGAPRLGSFRAGSHRGSPVALVASPSGDGYLVVTTTGRVFAFGRARTFGSVNKPLGSPITSAAMTPDGRGYWLVSADGVVHRFGDARAVAPPTGLAGTVVAILPAATDRGYWLVTSTGSVRPAGSAHDDGSLPASAAANGAVVGAAASPLGDGYWLLSADGEVTAFGRAHGEGSPVRRLESGAAAIAS